METRWRLSELAERSRNLLEEPGAGSSRRVRWKPTPRLIRYYTTLGLLDRPVEMRGRTAYYGPRHLHQLVAVKRLQLAGHTLQEIQVRLAGCSDRELREIAGLPAGTGALPRSAPETGPVGFWERAPRRSAARRPEPEEPCPSGSCLGRGGSSEREGSAVPREGGDPDAHQGLPRWEARAELALAPGARLLLDPRLLEGLDSTELERLLRPLEDYLRSSGSRKPPKPETTKEKDHA